MKSEGDVGLAENSEYFTLAISDQGSEQGTVRGIVGIVDRYLTSTTKHTIPVDRSYRDRARGPDTYPTVRRVVIADNTVSMFTPLVPRFLY